MNMGKIQFDLQTWLKDKSQKVVTRDNIPVKIICTDCNSCQPIVALVPTIDGKQETVETYNENGKYFNNMKDANLDLFIVTEDEPITEFEKGVTETILAGRTIVGNDVDPRYVKPYAEKLLYLAKEQLKQEGWEYTDPLLKECIADAEKKKFANEIIAEYKRVWDLLPDANKDSFTTEETIMYGKFMELEYLYEKFCEPIGVTLDEEEKNNKHKLNYTINGEPISKEPNIVDVSEFVHEKTVDYDEEVSFEKWLDDWYKEHKDPAYHRISMTEKEFKNFCHGIRNMYEQKQEWSEEDEETIKSACYYLKEYGNHICDVNLDKANRIYKTADALKSLHPHWKPSKEQIEYLAKAIITLGEEGDCKTAGVLNEIRNHLKDACIVL